VVVASAKGVDGALISATCEGADKDRSEGVPGRLATSVGETLPESDAIGVVVE
jgi:hypothetical protein